YAISDEVISGTVLMLPAPEAILIQKQLLLTST
ncbi:hypothetical protein JL09_g6710, partial [Pichia kudriavzevii]